MNSAKIEQYLADYQPNKPILNMSEVNSKVIDSLSADSIDSITRCIRDIQMMIEERRQLNDKIVKDLEKTELEIGNFLSQMTDGKDGREQMILFKTKAIEVAEARRNEKIDCWKDIAKLKEELRVYTRELEEKQSRKDMLDSILNEQ